MVKSSRGGESPVQGLLDERHQLETWLSRLAQRSDAPAHVLARIRQDYEQRLQQLIQELKRHSQALRDGLSGREDARRRLAGDAQDLEDRLAEARLRHEVGEYRDDEWERIDADGESELAAVRARLATVHDEIERLSEVVRLIEASDRRPDPAPPRAAPSVPAAPPADVAPPAAAPSPTPAAPPAPPTRPAPQRPSAPIMPELVPPVLDSVASTEAAEPSDEGTPVEQSATPPRPGRNTAGVAQTEAFDEMAFLKSVTEDDVPVQPKRASGAHRGPTLVRDQDAPAPRPSSPFRRPSAGQAEKTLRCAECGQMNLPTEWYCEQCGAELAAL